VRAVLDLDAGDVELGAIVAQDDLLLYVRVSGRERLLIALNLGAEPTAVTFPSNTLSGRVLVSSSGDRDDEPVLGTISLRGHEGAVVELAEQTALP